MAKNVVQHGPHQDMDFYGHDDHLLSPQTGFHGNHINAPPHLDHGQQIRGLHLSSNTLNVSPTIKEMDFYGYDAHLDHPGVVSSSNPGQQGLVTATPNPPRKPVHPFKQEHLRQYHSTPLLQRPSAFVKDFYGHDDHLHTPIALHSDGVVGQQPHGESPPPQNIDFYDHERRF